MNRRRIFLKLSGEALAGHKKTGFDEDTVKEVARQVKLSVDLGIQVGIVIGGGNFWRGRTSEAIDRTKADQIGMLATVMNCIYVSEIFRNAGMKTQILTPFACGAMTQLFSKDRANKYFEKGMVVFLLVVPGILIFLPIPVSRCGQLRWMRIVFCWRSLLMEYTTVIRRKIRRQSDMIRSLFRRLSTKNWQ